MLLSVKIQSIPKARTTIFRWFTLSNLIFARTCVQMRRLASHSSVLVLRARNHARYIFPLLRNAMMRARLHARCTKIYALCTISNNPLRAVQARDTRVYTRTRCMRARLHAYVLLCQWRRGKGRVSLLRSWLANDEDELNSANSLVDDTR